MVEEEEGGWRDLRERKVNDTRVRIARVSRDPRIVSMEEEDEDDDNSGGFTADIGGGA